MPTALPQTIEPRGLARRGARLQGNMPLKELHRLRNVLAVVEGRLELDLQFDTDAKDHAHVQGTFALEPILQCQRCLENLTVPIEGKLALSFVEPGQDAGVGPYEAFPVGDESIRLADLVEDEVILALPIVPRHENPVCTPPRGQTDEPQGPARPSQDTRRPFAGLRDLIDKSNS